MTVKIIKFLNDQTTTAQTTTTKTITAEIIITKMPTEITKVKTIIPAILRRLLIPQSLSLETKGKTKPITMDTRETVVTMATSQTDNLIC